MGAAETPERPIKLFYSYSHRDEELRKRLEDHLAGLRWSGMIAEWHDRNIDVGDEWAKEIDRNLSSADIILLLVSASFIASAYCWSVEMKKALERHDKGEGKVIPVILRPCGWHITPFAKLQAAPTDAKPVTSWPDQETALYDVARKIERAVTDLQKQRRFAAEQAQKQAEEARRRTVAKARQAIAEQQQDVRGEQDEACRAAEAEAARVPRLAFWSAAEWFHNEVQRGNTHCQNALLHLVWLFLQGYLYIFQTRLPHNGREICVLSTRPLTDRDTLFQEVPESTSSVVGAFSNRFPFWTVPACFLNIDREIAHLANMPTHPVPVTISLKENSRCATIYGPAFLIASQGTLCSAQFSAIQQLSHSPRDWVIHFRTHNRSDFIRCVDTWKLLSSNVEVYEGSLSIPSIGAQSYQCEIRGVLLRKLILDEDSIVVSDSNGFQYYDVRRTVGDNTVMKRVLGALSIDMHPQFVDSAQPFFVIVGGIMISAEGL